MKMTMTVEAHCTPDEARQFFGLPDVKPMQDAVERRMLDAVSAMAMPDAFLRAWLPFAPSTPDPFQKAMVGLLTAPFWPSWLNR
jgi:Family of unknown function (DUF6489)